MFPYKTTSFKILLKYNIRKKGWEKEISQMSKRKRQNMEKKPENSDGWTRLSHKNDYPLQYSWGFPRGSDGKESAYNAGDPGSSTGSGKNPEEGNGYPFQYSCLENSMDSRAWQATVHGVTKSWAWLSD